MNQVLEGFQGLDAENLQSNLRNGQPMVEESVINYGQLHGYYPVDLNPVITEGYFQGCYMMIHLDRPLTNESVTLLHQELIEAVNQTQESILITDAQLDKPGPKIVYVNPGFTRLTGYEPSEVIGKTPRLLQGEETSRSELNRLKQSLQKGESYEGEVINYKKDGTPYILQWETTPLKDNNGKINHYLAVQRDVSEQRRLEQQFEKSEVRLTQYLGDIPVGIAIHNKEKILYANQEVADLAGYDSPAELVEKDLFRFIRSDSQEKVQAHIIGLLEKGKEVVPREGSIISIDGQEKEVQITGIPCFYQGKQAIEIILIDISKRKAAERESQMQAEKYRRIAENTGDMLAQHYPDGTFSYASPSTATETGYEPHEVVGRSPFGFIHRADQDFMNNILQRISKGEAIKNACFRIRSKRGDVLWLESSFIPLGDDYPEAEQIQSITSEVTHELELKNILDEAQEMANLGGWQYDPEKDSLLLSPKVKDLIEMGPDYSPDVEDIMTLHDTEYKPVAEKCMRNLIDYGTPFDRTFKLRVNGKVKWMQVKGKAYYIDQRVYRIGGAVQEITEEKEAEIARDRLFGNAMELMTILDQGKVEHTNEAWTRVLGWSQEELQKMNLSDIIHPDYQELTQKMMAQAEKQKVSDQFENYLLCKNGDYKRLEGFGIKDDEKDVIYSFALDVTEEKAAKEALQESEEKFRALSEGAVIGIFLFQDGKLQYANPRLAEITGCSLEELQGSDKLLKMAHPDDQEAIKSRLAGSHDSFESNFDQFRFYAANTELRHGELHSTQIMYGGEWAILGSLIDITERKQAEEALEEYRYFMQKVNENSPTLITIIDLRTGQFIYENGRSKDFTGYGIRELNAMQGHFIESCVHPDDVRYYREFLEKDQTLEDGEINQTQVRIQTSDGTYKWIQMVHAPFKRDENGHVVQVINTGQDIDEWRNLMESYKLNEQYFRQLFQNSAAGLILLDPEYNIQACNQAFESIFKWDKKAILGSNPKALIVPEGKEEESDKISHETLNNRPYAIESQRQDKDGNEIPVYITGVPIYIDDKPVGTFHVYQDISERKNNEKALRDQTNELLRANQELEQFAYITSHNLRSPIANLKGLLELLDGDGMEDGLSQPVFEKMQSAVYELDGTVSDLADIVSRKNQLEQPKEKVDFQDILKRVKLSLANVIEESGAKIEGDFTAAPKIYHVRVTLQNILHELLENALKFQAPDRTPHIVVKTEKIEGYIGLSVTDNGIGFNTEKDGRKVFNFYKKLDPNTPGKGKGLYVVNKLVKSLNSKIVVDSKINKGTTFFIYLEDFQHK